MFMLWQAESLVGRQVKMAFSRWYDKYSNLTNLLNLLQKVDDYNIELIAQDFLQIIMEKHKDKFDETIQKMSSNPVPRFNRWYDKNYNLHTCIEFIKTIDDDQKEELINAFIMSLVSFITNNNHAHQANDPEETEELNEEAQ